MKYINIPMSDKDYPESAKIDQFLKLIDDPATGKFYVHCAGGRHRTGVMGAVYRFNRYNWNYDQAYAEMKKYDFYTRWGHGDMKKFVQDYAANFRRQINCSRRRHQINFEPQMNADKRRSVLIRVNPWPSAAVNGSY